jgi:hypothetical protein
MNCRKQYSSCSLRGKLAEVAVYSLVRNRFCWRKHSAADYWNLLGSRGIGAGSSPIGCEGVLKASKVEGSSLLLSNADNFVGCVLRYVYLCACVCFVLYTPGLPTFAEIVHQCSMIQVESIMTARFHGLQWKVFTV